MNTQVHLFILSIIVVLGGYFGYSEIKKMKGKLLSLEKEKDKEVDTTSNNYNVPVNQLSNTNNITNLDELEQSNRNNLDLEYDNLEVKPQNTYNISTYYDKYGESINYIKTENNETAISDNHLEERTAFNSILDDEVTEESNSSDSQLEESIIDDILLDIDTNNNPVVDTNILEDTNLLEKKNIDGISLDSESNTTGLVFESNSNGNLLEATTMEDNSIDDISLDSESNTNHVVETNILETNMNGEPVVETNIDEYQKTDNDLDDNVIDLDINSNLLMVEDETLNQLEHKIEKQIEYSMEEKTIVENYLDQTQQNDKEDLKKLYSKYSVKQLKEEFIKIGQSVPKGKKEILVDELINLTIK